MTQCAVTGDQVAAVAIADGVTRQTVYQTTGRP